MIWRSISAFDLETDLEIFFVGRQKCRKWNVLASSPNLFGIMPKITPQVSEWSNGILPEFGQSITSIFTCNLLVSIFGHRQNRNLEQCRQPWTASGRLFFTHTASQVRRFLAGPKSRKPKSSDTSIRSAWHFLMDEEITCFPHSK